LRQPKRKAKIRHEKHKQTDEDAVMAEERVVDRAAALAAIAEEVRVCKKCKLYQYAKNGVPGAGDPNAEIMFIGEGPGYHEDQQGLPFVGRSGDYLNYLLNLIGLKREQVFIGNVVKHRPPENRDPEPDEILACKPYLDRQEVIIDPLVIVTLGRFSMARYFANAKISAIHGQPKFEDNRAILPLYHPAAVLRNPALRSPMEADVKRIPALVAKVKEMRAGGQKSPTPNKPSEEDDAPPKQLSMF
jgi:uracil-DNA glycosylase